jgi:hypothetical protein
MVAGVCSMGDLISFSKTVHCYFGLTHRKYVTRALWNIGHLDYLNIVSQ